MYEAAGATGRWSGRRAVPGRVKAVLVLPQEAAPSAPQSLLSGYDDVSDAPWRVGSLEGPCGSWRGRQQEQGQGVAQPVLVVVWAPSSMAGEFGICVGIGESTVGGRGVCGAHSFAEGSVVEQHGNVGGLVPVATLTICGDEFRQRGVGGAGVSQDAMCERRALRMPRER